MRKKIGALTIGQTPRPDLIGPLRRMNPDCKFIEAGALDSLTAADLPDASQVPYPLTTRMRDGTVVTVGEGYLAPLLQGALDRLERRNVSATVLLCAGSFSELRGEGLLFKPMAVATAVLRALGMERIGVLSPIEAQALPIREKWTEAGFAPTVWVAPLEGGDERLGTWLADRAWRNQGLQCVVLDYVGHTADQVESLQEAVDLPVLDLGHLTAAALTSCVSGKDV